VFQTKIGVKRQGFSLPFGVTSVTFSLSYAKTQFYLSPMVNNYSRLGALKRVLHQALAARLVTMSCVGISLEDSYHGHIFRNRKKGKLREKSPVLRCYIHKRFGILVSSGTVYSLLYSLERDSLIKGVWNQRKRFYTLTEKGEQNIKVITKANGEIQSFLRNMLVLS